LVGAFQRHRGRVLLAFVSDIPAGPRTARFSVLGVASSTTYFTTWIHQSRFFEDVFVAPNPGNAGLVVGAALAASVAPLRSSRIVSSFLGPEQERLPIHWRTESGREPSKEASDSRQAARPS
jgi:predicted NodU family carbamoyl transferase